MKVESGHTIDIQPAAKKTKQTTNTVKEQANINSQAVETRKQPKVSIDNSAQNLLKLQAIASKFGLDKDRTPDKNKLTLEQRATRRERLKQVQKQQNLEQIMEHAAEYIDNSKINDEVDPDWLYQFFDAAETIYSQPMQALWGKILAMQTAKPNRFSLRTLVTLKKMTYQEACTFQAACAMLVKDKTGTGGKIYTGLYQQHKLLSWFKSNKVKSINLSKFGLNYPDLLSLIDLGLIYSSEIESSPLRLGQALSLESMQNKIQLIIKHENTVLTYYKLTQAGQELTSLIATNVKQDYFKQLSEVFFPEVEVVQS